MIKFTTTTLALLCFAFVTGTTADERQWPDRKFKCQVETESGARGLVELQTYSRSHAVRGVAKLDAITDRDSIERTETVIQCIEPIKGERFSDTSFQSWLSTLEE